MFLILHFIRIYYNANVSTALEIGIKLIVQRSIILMKAKTTNYYTIAYTSYRTLLLA